MGVHAQSCTQTQPHGCFPSLKKGGVPAWGRDTPPCRSQDEGSWAAAVARRVAMGPGEVGRCWSSAGGGLGCRGALLCQGWGVSAVGGVLWGPLAEGTVPLYLFHPPSRAAHPHQPEPVSFPLLCETQASSVGTSRGEPWVPSLPQRRLPGGETGVAGPSRCPSASPQRWPTLPAAIPPHIPGPTASRCQAGSALRVPGMCRVQLVQNPAGMNPHRWERGEMLRAGRAGGRGDGGQGWDVQGGRTASITPPGRGLDPAGARLLAATEIPAAPCGTFLSCQPLIPIQDLRWGGKNLLPAPAGDRAGVMDGSWARQIWGRYGEGEIRLGARQGGGTAASHGVGSTRPRSQLYGGQSLVSVLKQGWSVVL